MYKIYSNGVLVAEYADIELAKAKATELCNSGEQNVCIDVSETLN